MLFSCGYYWKVVDRVCCCYGSVLLVVIWDDIVDKYFLFWVEWLLMFV